jgi:hypothetical protein
MAATTYEAVRTFWMQKAPWLTPVIGQCSAAGNVAYLIDTAMWQDPSALGLSAKTLSNMFIFRPDAAAAGDRKRSIGGNSGSPVDTTNGRLYPKVAWTNLPASAEQYEITAMDPQILFDLLVQALEQFYIPHYSPLSMFADSDMETSGTSNYTISGAGSITKVATAVNVHTGSQSLFFNAGTASENVKGPAVRVVPERAYDASAIVRVDGGGPAAFAIWDVTNNIEIESSNRIEHSYERFISMQRTFTTPATCEEVELRVYVTGATDDVYIDTFSGPRKSTDSVINAPSTLESDKYLRKLLVARYSDNVGDGLYDANSRTFDEVPRQNFHVRVNHNHANPYQIEMRHPFRLPKGELWIEMLKKTSDVYTAAWTAAGETTTIPLPKALIGYESLKRICHYILAGAPDDSQVMSTLRMIEDPRGEYKALLKDYARDLESPQYAAQPSTWSINSL